MFDTYDADLVAKLKSIRFEINLNNKDLIFFLSELEFYYETENILFTHAGYNTTLSHWTCLLYTSRCV